MFPNFSVSFTLNLKVEGVGCLPSMHKAMSSILRPLQKKKCLLLRQKSLHCVYRVVRTERKSVCRSALPSPNIVHYFPSHFAPASQWIDALPTVRRQGSGSSPFLSSDLLILTRSTFSQSCCRVGQLLLYTHVGCVRSPRLNLVLKSPASKESLSGFN